jgi:hypothetical protein
MVVINNIGSLYNFEPSLWYSKGMSKMIIIRQNKIIGAGAGL